MKKAYDIHMHLLPLNHVCLSAYLEFATHNSLAEAYAQATAADYIVPGVLKREGNALDIVAVMERSAAEQIALYEADLCGVYAGGKSQFPPYDKLVISPQIMDFNIKAPLSTNYSDAPDHDILRQALDILSAIDTYYAAHPDGKLEVLPFIGINPLNYTESYIQHVLETCFPQTASHEEAAAKARFGGVKVYPPMGFDPAPEDEAAAEKVELLFSFCESNAIPIVTHCDDQGFRMLPLEDSFRFTSPERWEKVLERHPNLWIDFAHFGEQYYRGLPVAQLKDWPQKILNTLKKTELTWRDRILRLMKTYPHVYTDVSFGGATCENWNRLMDLFEKQSAEERALYESRVLFGTDWPLSLTKAPSVLHYWRGFTESCLPQELQEKLVHTNPETFLFHQAVHA